MYKEYYRPGDLEEAQSILAEYKGKARVMAGGTDLILQLKAKAVTCEAVVDISFLEELRYIAEEDDDGQRIRIGALSTHTDLAESNLLKQRCSFLCQAAASVGSLQIRNVGTIGGNIINAQPAADTAVPLAALDARCQILTGRGKQTRELKELYRPEGGTSLDPTSEILTEISFFLPAGTGSAFGRAARRKALALPVFNTAVVITPGSGRNRISTAKIVMGPVARTPFRAEEAEKQILTGPPGKEMFQKTAALAASEAQPRDSVFRGPAAYRKQLAEVIIYRTLERAWEESISKLGGE